jgi:hypothetical protein
MGVISTAKVITSSDRAGRLRTLQLGNREWVSVIEAINTHRVAILPLIIFSAVIHQKCWYDWIPDNWSIAVSENGWTNNKIRFT